jgi:6-phosphogluconolactonase
MANEIHINEYKSKDELFVNCSESIISEINQAFFSKNEGTILLSGGSTPEPLYKLLAKNDFVKSKVQWGLVDERFVEFSSDYSNEKMIRNALGDDAEIVGMVSDSKNYISNLIEINERYKSFIKETDISILGMGGDGHFASLFPGDESSEKVLNSNEKAIFNTTAPSFPERRVSCSFQMLLESKSIYLIITGQSKKDVLLNSELNLPIHKLLAKRNDIKIYYAD